MAQGNKIRESRTNLKNIEKYFFKKGWIIIIFGIWWKVYCCYLFWLSFYYIQIFYNLYEPEIWTREVIFEDILVIHNPIINGVFYDISEEIS